MLPQDDDDDICPVCESDCTCNKDSPPSPDRVQTAVSPLKIKLTVPQSIRANLTQRPASQLSAKHAMLAGDASGGIPAPTADHAAFSATAHAKRKPRPPKGSSASLRGLKAAAHARSLSARAHASRSTALTRAPRNKTSGLLKTASRRVSGSRLPAVPHDRAYVFLHDPEHDDSASDAFPAFVSAHSSSDEDDADEDTDSSPLDSGDDSDIEAEEERHIVAEESLAKEKARVRREMLGDNNGVQRKWERYNWQVIPNKKSPAASADGGAVDAATDSDADQTEDDEDDEMAADEPEPDAVPSTDLVQRRYWTQSEDDDDFDAAVFFASLTSDGERDSGTEDASAGSDLGEQSLDEAAQAGLLPMLGGNDSSEFLPFVTQDIHGHLVFSNEAKSSSLDLTLDISIMPAASSPPSSAPQDEDAMQVDSDHPEEPVEEALDEWDDGTYSDGGDTTDDMLNGDFVPTVRGVMPVRCPTPPVAAVDPMSTVSTPKEVKRRLRKMSQASASDHHVASPTASDILARLRSKSLSRSGSGSLNGSDVGSPSLAGSTLMSRLPAMGKFESPSSDARAVIIDGTTTDIPSPFAQRRYFKRGSAGSRPESRGSYYKRVRRAPSPLPEDDANEQSMAALQLDAAASDFIDLNEVLDAAALEGEPEPSASESDVGADLHRHLRNLSRWDKIPMNVFRHRGATPATNLASYGAALGSVLRGAANAAWWDTGVKKRSGLGAISPVMKPVRDGERTPRLHPTYPPSKEKERRRKKGRLSDPAIVKRPSHIQRVSSLVAVPPLRL